MVKPRKCSAFWYPGLSINHHLASPQILGHGSKLWLSVFPTRVPPDVRLVWICTDLGLRGLRGSAVNLGRHQRGPSLGMPSHGLQRFLDNPFMCDFVSVIGRPSTCCHNVVET